MGLVGSLAWRNLWRHGRRTWLTTGGMVFANVLLVFMISLQVGMYGLMISNTLEVLTGHLQVQAPGYLDEKQMRLTVPDAARLAADLRGDLGSAHVAARSTAFVLASSEERSYGIMVYGVEPAHEPGVSTLPGLVDEGRWLEAGDAERIVLGSTLARNLRVSVGDSVTLFGSGRDGSFAAGIAEVTGILDSGITELDRSVAEIPLDWFDEVFSMRGAGHQVVIRAPDLERVPALEARVRELLPADAELEVHDWDTLEPGLKEAIQADIGSAFFMYGVLVILVGFSVLNTQLMSVLERTREFGVVMALGVTPGRLSRLVLYETAIMGALGVGLGALLGGLVTLWFSVAGFSWPGMEEMAARFNLPSRLYPEVTPLSLFAGPLVVFACTLLAALYPALRLNWLEPVEAMQAP